jgi:hypothetical protein
VSCACALCAVESFVYPVCFLCCRSVCGVYADMVACSPVVLGGGEEEKATRTGRKKFMLSVSVCAATHQSSVLKCARLFDCILCCCENTHDPSVQLLPCLSTHCVVLPAWRPCAVCGWQWQWQSQGYVDGEFTTVKCRLFQR